MRPFTELDLGYQFRLYEMHSAVALWLAEKRAVWSFQLLKPLPHLRVALLIEAASGLADGNQPMPVVIQTQNKRAEVRARALGLRVTADNALLGLRNLDLQPLTAALLDILAVAPLANNAFESALSRDLIEFNALGGEMVGIADDAAIGQQLSQQALAIFECGAEE